MKKQEHILFFLDYFTVINLEYMKVSLCEWNSEKKTPFCDILFLGYIGIHV